MNSEQRRLVLPALVLAIVVVAAGASTYILTKQKGQLSLSNGGQPSPSTLPPAPPVPPEASPAELLTQAPEEPREPVTEADFNLQTPNGGEVFSVSQSLRITYSISQSFRDKLKASDLTELYLLDTENVLVGYVGEVDVTANEFLWDPQKLLHNAGLTMLISPAPLGQYRILLLSRHPSEPTCIDCDFPVDTWDGPSATFENGYLVDSETAKRYDANYRGFRPLATDVSASLFTLK